MEEFFSEHWININWETAITAVVIFTPVVITLFYLIANHCREKLKTTESQLESANSKISELNERMFKAEYTVNQLQNQRELANAKESWEEVELEDEEAFVLSYIANNDTHRLTSQTEVSKARVQLAITRLLKLTFIAHGTEGYFALQPGLEWLQHNDLLDLI